MMPIKIRQPLPNEAAKMTNVILRSKQANGYGEAFMALCVEELSVTPERLKQRQYWVADEAGEVCGVTCLVTDKQTGSGEIHSFFVDPNHQRKGIGRLLWNTILARAKQQNLTRLHLDSDPAAVEFYQTLGFKIIGETPSGSIPGRVLPLMEYKLV